MESYEGMEEVLGLQRLSQASRSEVLDSNCSVNCSDRSWFLCAHAGQNSDVVIIIEDA